MSEGKNDHTPPEKSLQVDRYGIKLRISPTPQEESRPETWREVLRRVNQHLMSIAEGSFGTLADALQGLRRLIRGTTSLPASISKRIEGAHHSTAEREKGHQEALGAFLKEQLYLRGETLTTLQVKLRELQEKGLAAGLTFDSAGNPVLYVIEPSDLKFLEERVQGTLQHTDSTDIMEE